MIHMKGSAKTATSTARVEEAPSTLYRSGRGTFVQSCVLGDEAGRGLATVGIIGALKAGLPFRELEDLRDLLDLPMDRLAAHLGISRATLHRRKTSGRLDAGESDRVLRFGRLLGLGLSVMESLDLARRWLASPQVGLGGETPLVYAETEVGAREVEDLLGRIEFGVYA